MKNWINPQHLIVSIGFTMVAYWLGCDPIYASLIISAFWAGREHGAAEYNYIWYHTDTHRREEMPWWGGFAPKAWTAKGFWADMVIPFIACLSIAMLVSTH